MPVHGSKRFIQGKEEIFHQIYGWMNAQEFFDLISEFNDEELPLEPENMSRQSGESFNQYKSRLRDMEDIEMND